jgi:putative ABC transport system permease protein
MKLFAGSLVLENLRISMQSVRSHMMRTTLTVLIIAFGIMALVGILTSIDAIKYYLNDNFQMMGANTFTIRNRTMQVHIGNKRSKPKNFREISFEEAMRFKDLYTFPATPSVFIFATNLATVKYAANKTNPNVPVIGCDENYIITSGNEIVKGRNISPTEVYYGSSVALVGSDVIKKVFKNNEDPVGKYITIGPGRYLIVGILKEKGSSLGFNPDNVCLIPINSARQRFSRPNASYSINIHVADGEKLEAAIDEATGIFRIVRQVSVGDEDSFDISKSDNLANMLFDSLSYLRLAAVIIGAITLLGAAIGLMNIMLVSVTERTREIGIRKAIGATKHTIRNQFLAEAVVIAQLGGILGIILGIAIGNALALSIGTSFIVPWRWIFWGVGLCVIVALASGIIPAVKAAKLDPIDALRYE